MTTYYCNHCSQQMLVQAIDPRTTNLTGSYPEYDLLEKFKKHFKNSGSYQVNTVFLKDDFEDQSDYDIYEFYHFMPFVSGSLEIDHRRRKNMVLSFVHPTGELFLNGQYSGEVKAVKLVLFEDAHKIHAFPTSSAYISSEICANCGHRLDEFDVYK